MLLKRSGGRGSRYAKKIEPITLHIAYEGKEDEKEYFDAFSKKIKKRFRNIVKLVPVPKSSSISRPEVVKNDLVAHLKENGINLLKTKSHLGFIVIDKDHFFEKKHQKSTWQTITECNQKGIKVICSAPCFEVWLLCHYLDISIQDDNFKSKALRNKKSGKNARSFLKTVVSKYRNGEGIDKVLDRLEVAFNNERKLKEIAIDRDKVPPDELLSNVGVIIEVLLANGIPIFEN